MRRIFLVLSVFLLLFFSFNHAYSEELEIKGLVINQTKAKIGRDFFKIFFQELGEHDKHNITIKELITSRTSSWLEVYVDLEKVYRQAIRPQNIDQHVFESVRRVKQYIAYTKINGGLKEGDLIGNGIY